MVPYDTKTINFTTLWTMEREPESSQVFLKMIPGFHHKESDRDVDEEADVDAGVDVSPTSKRILEMRSDLDWD
jgi:hypothetical protein